MVSVLVFGTELGGLASTLPSDLDPALARLGVRNLGNIAFAGSVRTDLLNGVRELRYDRERCDGCRLCFEVCPQGVWEMDEAKRAVLAHLERCTACRACLTQCTAGAIGAAIASSERPPREAAEGRTARAACETRPPVDGAGERE